MEQAETITITPENSAGAEPAIDPERPIIDPHHHLWDFPATAGRPARRYVLADFLADVEKSGHRIVQSVFVECGTMYRPDGQEALQPLGETEFVRRIADEGAARGSSCSVAAATVARADLLLGAAVEPILDAHQAAAAGRLRAIRNVSAWDAFPVLGFPLDPARTRMLSDPAFREGMAALTRHGLCFDAYLFHTQLPDLSDLASACPDTTIVLDHVATPLGVGPYADKRAEVFAIWKAGIEDLARRPNVIAKLGGFGMRFFDPPYADRTTPPGSAELADRWRPYVETCIAAFGPERCMFESNFPPDSATCGYGTLWNTFKRLAADYSEAEKTAMFSGVARRIYRLDPSDPTAPRAPDGGRGAHGAVSQDQYL